MNINKPVNSEEMANTLTLKTILNAGREDLLTAKNARILASAKMDYDALISLKKKEIFSLEGKLESLNDVDKFPTTEDDGVVVLDTAKYVTLRSSLLVSLELKKSALAILTKDANFYGA